ncbi:hypothetical protein [Carnobacterium sp. ISL-102]|uniref:hypothetical protein n=1 Tax=Carnobacterium sp. ISL-102 TaxID=2819142 RepID=UPI001BE65FC5|nr:hypothetical protein [Carnobacterium sp. ISL-102]MBT2731094.1 hypothetical protein [Carnobacterium sp. ISL-102]
MQTQVFFKESKRFLLENKKRILLFTILGAVVFALFTVVNLITDNSDSSSEDTQTEEISNIAEFVIYIEKNDDTHFNNNVLLEEALFSDEAVKIVEKETGAEITDLLTEQEEIEFVPTAEDRGVIGIVRDLSNETMKFQFKVGTESENLKVANYYFDMIMNNEVELLSDKKIFVLNSPEIKDLTQADVTLIEESNNVISPLLLVVQLVVSLFAGLILGVLVSILYHVFNKKINYAFNYNINEKDIFIMERESQDKFIYDIVNPKSEDKIMVIEQALPNELVNKLSEQSQKIMTTSNLLEISSKVNAPEIIIVIVENTTTKFWYNTQREYLKKFDSAVKIIQVPESIFKEEK